MTKHGRRGLALYILGSTLLMGLVFKPHWPARSEPWLLGLAVFVYLFIRVWLVEAFMVRPLSGTREWRKQRIQEAERKEAALWRSWL